jgi:predicted amidohydrolase
MAANVLRVAAVQMSSQADLGANLSECRRLLGQAGAAGASLVVLPENFAYFGPESGKRQLAERIGDETAPIQALLAESARTHGIVVIGGGMPERSNDPERPHNTAVVIGPNGKVIASYRKIHLFDVDLAEGSRYRESANTTAGSTPVVVPVGGFGVGLSVCYDVRFPELYRALVDRGADVLTIPAAFTVHTGKDHWHVLIRARAIESQAWVIAAAQCGAHPQGRTTYGHSMVVDPWGTPVAEASDHVGVVVADVNRSYLEKVRATVPSLKHRRL